MVTFSRRGNYPVHGQYDRTAEMTGAFVVS
jgi:plastocyanin